MYRNISNCCSYHCDSIRLTLVATIFPHNTEFFYSPATCKEFGKHCWNVGQVCGLIRITRDPGFCAKKTETSFSSFKNQVNCTCWKTGLVGNVLLLRGALKLTHYCLNVPQAYKSNPIMFYKHYDLLRLFNPPRA